MALALEIVPQKALLVRREKEVVAASWFGPTVLRPYVYPFIGPGGAELTRLGHPLDPVSHSHHRSIWIGHRDVSGVDFWEESPQSGRIEQTAAAVQAARGEEVSALLDCAWKAPDGRTLLQEKRRLAWIDLGRGELALEIDTELRAGAAAPVVLGDTPFGLLGIRVARSMRVAEGLGGRIMNSEEGENEAGCLWQHARWCDYSGPVVAASTASPKEKGDPAARPGGGLPAAWVGIVCFSHPQNVPAETLWHVRDDGWMGPCISKGEPRAINPEASLRARYRLEGHAGRAEEADLAERFRRWHR